MKSFNGYYIAEALLALCCGLPAVLLIVYWLVRFWVTGEPMGGLPWQPAPTA